MEYLNSPEINETGLYEPFSQQRTDIQMPAAMNVLLLAIWVALCLFGFAVILIAGMPVAGTVIIAVPTFIGMVIKPTFALSIMMLILPAGAGTGVQGGFAVERGVGIAFAASFVLNVLITRPALRIRAKALWVSFAYTIYTFLVALASPDIRLELTHSFTQFQLLILILIVYWVLDTNGEPAFRWALRAYVAGSVGAIMLTFITGAAMQAMEYERESAGRYTATVGGYLIDANMMSVLVAMAFFAAVYLFIRDKKLPWRFWYAGAILFLPVMMLKTGSRGGLVAFAFTLLSPLIFIKQVARRPALAVLMLIIIILAAGSTVFIFKSGEGLQEQVAYRLTDVGFISRSFEYRLFLVKTTLSGFAARPFGTGKIAWMARSGLAHFPHNDFCYALGLYGIPGAFLFSVIVILLILTVKRMPLGTEKLYARAVLTFLLTSGLALAQLGHKHYWAFLAFVICAEPISHLYADNRRLAAYDSQTEQTAWPQPVS